MWYYRTNDMYEAIQFGAEDWRFIEVIPFLAKEE